MIIVEDIVNSLEGELVDSQFIAEPDFYFWSKWKTHKDDIKSHRIKVYKENDKFKVSIPEHVYRNYKVEPSFKIEEDRQLPEIQNALFLRDYQVPHVRNLLYSFRYERTIIDGSDTGIGKTYCSIATAVEVGRPIFVVTAKSVIKGWNSAVHDTRVECLGIINYEYLKTGKVDALSIDKNDKTRSLKWNLPEDCIIIWDEAHRCKSPDTINSAMLIASTKQKYKQILLSATIGHSPDHLASVGYALGLFTREEYYSWALRHGMYHAKFKNRSVLQFSGSKYHLWKLHNAIYPRKGHRVTKKELGDKFPDNTILSIPYTMDNASKINRAIKQMNKELRELNKRKQQDVQQDNPLTIRLRARQEIELLKIPTFIELANDSMEEGNSVILFVNFQESLKSLAEHFKTKSYIAGGQSAKTRNKVIDDFQSNKTRLMIVNSQAGNVGIDLHDLDGNFPREVFISPPERAMDLKQSLGRAHRDGGKSKVIQKIVFCADTIEEKVCDQVKTKLDNIDMLNDGELSYDIVESDMPL